METTSVTALRTDSLRGVIDMRKGVVAACAVLVGGAAIVVAQGRTHTLVVLSHSNHTVYEMNPATGAVVHEFVAPDQPHEFIERSTGVTS